MSHNFLFHLIYWINTFTILVGHMTCLPNQLWYCLLFVAVYLLSRSHDLRSHDWSHDSFPHSRSYIYLQWWGSPLYLFPPSSAVTLTRTWLVGCIVSSIAIYLSVKYIFVWTLVKTSVKKFEHRKISRSTLPHRQSVSHQVNSHSHPQSVSYSQL